MKNSNKILVGLLCSMFLMSTIPAIEADTGSTEAKFDISLSMSFEVGDETLDFGSIGTDSNTSISTYVLNTGDVTVDYTIHTNYTNSAGEPVYNFNPVSGGPLDLDYDEVTMFIGNETLNPSYFLTGTAQNWVQDVTPNGNCNQSLNLSILTNPIGFSMDYEYNSIFVIVTGVANT